MSRGTIICLAAVAILGSAAAQNLKRGPYLALGDSLPFGYNPLIQPPDLSKYIGYPMIVSKFLHDDLTNASCPGETSGTFAGTSTEYYPGFDCAALRASNSLFVPYNGAPSQLEYAARFLVANHNTALVTVGIGGNDLGLLQYKCTIENPGQPAAVALCESSGLPAVLGTVAQNLVTIFSRLRSTGYTGQIVAVNYFAFNYADPLQVSAFTALNTVIATAATPFKVVVADAYAAFAIATLPAHGDACKAGLLLKLPDGTCDTHPSMAGQDLLAATVVFTTTTSGRLLGH